LKPSKKKKYAEQAKAAQATWKVRNDKFMNTLLPEEIEAFNKFTGSKLKVNGVDGKLKKAAGGNGYTYFIKENYPKYKQMGHRESIRELAKMWKEMSKEEKAKYQKLHEETRVNFEDRVPLIKELDTLQENGSHSQEAPQKLPKMKKENVKVDDDVILVPKEQPVEEIVSDSTELSPRKKKKKATEAISEDESQPKKPKLQLLPEPEVPPKNLLAYYCQKKCGGDKKLAKEKFPSLKQSKKDKLQVQLDLLYQSYRTESKAYLKTLSATERHEYKLKHQRYLHYSSDSV